MILYGAAGTTIITITDRDSKLRLWDASTYQVLATSEWSSASCLDLTTDGKRLITGGVPFAHAQSLAGTIRRADSHLVWLGADWPAIAARIRVCLDAEP